MSLGSRTFREQRAVQQNFLFPFDNPLQKRVGEQFFGSIPSKPGVYYFYGNEKILLYIGKSKDLRSRLRSYCHASPERASRKILRLVQMVHEIRYETCRSEQSALLKENELLRTLRPPFNRLNTRPEAYSFVFFHQQGEFFHFRLGYGEDRDPAEGVYGAFKNRGLVHRTYSALLRLLWIVFEGKKLTRFEFPVLLVSSRKIPVFSVKTSLIEDPALLQKWGRRIQDFFAGKSLRLVTALIQQALELDSLPRFAYHLVQMDLEQLKEFYETLAHRNFRLIQEHKIKRGFILQKELDDLLVLSRLGVKKKKKKTRKKR